jgi:polyhydroxybutyrate depolymerase
MRARRFALAAALLAVACLLVSGPGCARLRQALRNSSAGVHQINSGGMARTYVLHVPPSYTRSQPIPLVIAYHGHGGDGAGQERLSGMDATSDANGFIVAYPDGVDKSWNDGRTGAVDSGVDDIGFTSDLIAQLEKDYSIDARRVYATGLSNGGMMCYRVAMELGGKVAAVAPVAALMSQDLEGRGTPPVPVSLMLIAGTDDPLMPFNGGEIGLFLHARGLVIPAADTISFWVRADGCSPTPAVTQLPDIDPADGTRVTLSDYTGGTNGAEVRFYTVEGGGHAWPGGVPYLGPRIIGKTSKDFVASQAIWDFFKSHELAL